MSNQLPMAIEPSKEHILDNLLNCFTFIDTEKQLIIAHPVFLHLGYTVETAQAVLSNPMLRQLINCKGFVPREDYFISISQIGELIVNAPEEKYIPNILEFIKNILIPLFHPVAVPQIETLPAAQKPETMSSLEIAKLTGKEHKNVIRDIERIFTELKIEPSNYLGSYQDVTGRNLKCYSLDEELTITLTSGYSIPQRHAIIKEWQTHRRGQVTQSALPEIAPNQPENKLTDHRPTKQPNASFLKTTLQQIDSMKLSEEARQVLKAHLLHEQAGLPLDMMLPVITEEKLSPAQIGERLGISAQAVGSIISKLGIRNNQNYCESRLSKSPHCSKEIVVHYYNRQAVNMIKQAFLERQNNEKKN